MAVKPGAEFVRVDAHELRRLIERLRDVEDKKLKAALRKTLKKSADLAVSGVQSEVKERPRSSGRGRGSGLRNDLARATHASLLRGSERSGAEVKIVTADNRLAARHRGMVKAYNAGRFRHPVFADQSQTRQKWRWVEQEGQRNYFGRGVYGKRDEMQAALRRAMDDVTKNL